MRPGSSGNWASQSLNEGRADSDLPPIAVPTKLRESELIVSSCHSLGMASLVAGDWRLCGTGGL